jgi:hypothetical protein
VTRWLTAGQVPPHRLDPLVFGEIGPAQWDAHGPLRACLEHEVTWRGFGKCWLCESEAAR